MRDGQGPTSPRTGVGGPCPGPCRVSARPVGGAEGVGGPGTDGTVGRCPAEDPTATLAPGHEGGPSRTAHSTACSDDTAQLVVIADRGLGGVAGLLIGSVAFALAAGGSCPVVIVRGQTDATDGPVVVGVDGSPISEAALAFAFEAAALRGAPLLAVHAWRDVPLVAVHAERDVPLDPMTWASLDWDAVEQQAQAELAERLAGWRDKYPDVDVQRLVVQDRPAKVLVEQSAAAQLLVVGSRGRGGLAGLLLGSVSHAVLHRADCPVAIVRADIGAAAR